MNTEPSLNKGDVDFGKHALDYATHRAGFPASFFSRLDDLGILASGRRLLDLGTGTGTIARSLAQRGLVVTGLDPSENLLNEARELDRRENVAIEYLTGRAEQTGFPGASFDYLTAGQCWHWFEHDAVVREAKRLLRPRGHLIVAYFDWMEKPDNPVAVMYELRRKYNPRWKSEWPLGFYPQEPKDLQFDGFEMVTSFAYEENISYSHIGWRGRMRAYAGIGGSLPKPVVEEFDKEFAEVLSRKFPTQPMLIPHRVWAAVWRLPG